MNELTFAFDVQINDNEDWIPEGTKVYVYPHSLKKDDCTPVIIDRAMTYEGNTIDLFPQYEWFMNCCFVELN